MRFVLAYLMAVVLIAVPDRGMSETIVVPSGQPVTFLDVIWEEEGGKNIYRFRYIAPEIARTGGSVNFSDAEADLKHLCEVSALPALLEQGRMADKIIISLLDRVVEFGVTDSTATQFFDAFRPDGAACIWENF